MVIMVKKRNNRTVTMNRRNALAAIGGGITMGLAGCTGGSSTSEPEQEDYMIEDAPAPELGDGDTVVEVYVDFMCPHCSDWHSNEYERLVEEYVDTGEVTLVHRDFPLPVDQTLSWSLASSARYVQHNVGNEEFWDVAGCFLRNKQSFSSIEDIEECLSDYDVDTEEVISAGERNEYYPVLKTDREEGQENGVSGTPTVLVDGEMLEEPWEDTLFSALE